MKINFENNLKHQIQAIESTIDIFQGIDFSYPLNLQEPTLVQNLIQITQRNNQGQSNSLSANLLELTKELETINSLEHIPNFSIEMETGTGKTYVYLRTIFELNQKYNLNHFIIVTPSIAIREGIQKTLEITKEHFKDLYSKEIESFIYDSNNLTKLTQFAQAKNSIQVMIINIDAFNKYSEDNTTKSNKIYEARDDIEASTSQDDTRVNASQDDLFSTHNSFPSSPISQIQKTNPIVILDEPQNMTTEKSKKALGNLNPKFILRYSATHKEVVNLCYSLGPKEAFDKGLVKHIILHNVKEENKNINYIKVLKTENTNNSLSAKVELLNASDNIQKFTLKQGDELDVKSKNPKYAGYRVKNIDMQQGVEITGIKDYLKINEEYPYREKKQDSVLKDVIKIQIKETIKQHFKTQNLLKDLNIKVLSLFFLGSVEDYKNHNTNSKGEVAKIFEECFKEIQSQGRNSEIISYGAEEVHSGYFSKDKKGNLKNSKGESSEDKDTYSLIMKDKEKLLSFNEKVSFIFSHSALKEGWDNPNVFQICVLRDSKSEFTKRQQIGRGLRICVNQEGKRVYDEVENGSGINQINQLHLVVNESYEEFAKGLQGEYSEAGYNTVNVNEMIKNSKDTKKLEAKNLDSDAFKELWDIISQETFYQVNFDTKELIAKASERIKESLKVEGIKIHNATTKITDVLQATNLEKHKILSNDSEYVEYTGKIPAFISEIAKKCDLTKKTVYKILKASGRIEDVKKNPQEFMQQVVIQIKDVLKDLLKEGVKYEILPHQKIPIQDNIHWSRFISEIGENQEASSERVIGDVTDAFEHRKTILQKIPLDSKEEKAFLQRVKHNKDIKFFFKLPSFFKIKTPIGKYNPDFAYLPNIEKQNEINKDYNPRVYKMAFIKEIKHTENSQELQREEEKQKIEYAKKHFKAINDFLASTIDNEQNFNNKVEDIPIQEKNMQNNQDSNTISNEQKTVEYSFGSGDEANIWQHNQEQKDLK